MRHVTLAIVAMTIAALLAVGGGRDGSAFAQGGTPAMPILSVANGPNPGTAVFTWNVAPEATSYRVGWLAVEDYLAHRENDTWRQIFAYSDVADGSPWTVERLTPGIEYYFIVGLEHPGGVEWSAWDTLLLNADGMACPTKPPLPPTTDTGSTTTQAPHTLQFVCIHTELDTCKLIREFYVPRVHERANGAISIEITSYPQLGIAAGDGVDLAQDGTLDAIELYAESARDDFPMMEIENLWGVGADNDVHMDISNAVEDDIVRILREATGGEVIFRSVYPSELLFSREPLPNMASYARKLIRSRYPITSDLLRGVGAEPQFVAYLDMYTAFERGVVDGGVTAGFAGADERWYEVSDYLYGPFSGSRRVGYFVVTGDKWAQLSNSQRTILKEAGEEYEAENLRRLNEQWEPHGIGFNASRGMTFSDFPADVKAKMRETAVNVVIPKWVDRVGGPGSEGVRIFNEKVGPIVGVVINADGTASETN